MPLQLGLGLNRRLGGFNPFNPTHLNPHLLFDTRTSMLGELESPTLDLDPAVPSSLDVITATRAGVATYTDIDGNIQSADPNTVRIDHVEGVPMMLIEPSATNLVANTNFSDWTSRDVSVTDGAGYKGQTSKIITRIAGSFQSLFYYLFDAGDYTFSTEHTGSFWIRKVAGTNTQITIDFYRASSSQSSTINLTEEWQKVEIAITSPSSAWFRFGLFFAPSQTSLGDSVEIAMPQVEEGSVATSYIPTSGSTVTRNADNLVIDGTDFTDFYNDTEGTVYVEYEPRIVPTSFRDHYVAAAHNGFNHRITIIARAAAQAEIVTSGVTQASLDAGTPIANQLNRFALSYSANDFKASLDGGTEATDNSGTPPTLPNQFWIGDFVGSNSLNGHIKRLIYWPTHSDSL